VTVTAAWTRRLDPAVVKGSQLPDFSGVALDDLFVYKYSGGSWSQVPFQFDEVDSGGKYVASEDGVFDSNDELVFMGQDLGSRASTSEWLDDADSKNYSRYELQVTDPLDSPRQGGVCVSLFDARDVLLCLRHLGRRDQHHNRQRI